MTVEVAIGVATGLIVAVLTALFRWTKNHVANSLAEIRGLLVTDENGLGIVDRLEVIEDKVDDLMTPVLATAERTMTLEPNGGSSMHDRVARIDDNTPDVKAGGPAHASRPSTKKAPARKAAPRRRTQ